MGEKRQKEVRKSKEDREQRKGIGRMTTSYLFSFSNTTRAIQQRGETICKALTDVLCTWLTRRLSEKSDTNPNLYNITVYLREGTP